MRNFLCVTTGLDVLPLLYAVSNQPWLWDQDTIRTTHPGSVHKDVSDILVHFQRPEDIDTTTDRVHDCFPRPAWWALPEARPLIFGLMTRVQATRLGRVMLTRLPAGASIPPHIDAPAQTAYYRRHQITLCAPPECTFVIEDETMALPPGSCFRVNNGVEHSVWNDGPTERIALIVDVHVPAMRGGAP